jgi:Tol biopolymer transport system component
MPPLDRLACVNTDGHIITISPDGSGQTVLTEAFAAKPQGLILGQAFHQSPLFFTWPTWAPGGARMALSQVTLAGESPGVFLTVLDLFTGEFQRIHQNHDDSSPVIAQNVPHYACWSPDGARLAFIASTPEGLGLFVHTLGGETTLVMNQGPLFLRWTDDSQGLFIHSRERLLYAREPFTDPPKTIAPMDPSFRNPDVSYDGRRVAFITSVGQGPALILGDVAGPGPFQALSPVGGNSAILFSPTGDTIAVAEAPAAEATLYARLRLVAPDTTSRVLIDEPLLAFFWSPDGNKIAYFSLNAVHQELTLKVLDVVAGEPRPLARFAPSVEFLAMLGFFDQYAHSHRIWSPDSTRLVFCGALHRHQAHTNGHSQIYDRIHVINTEADPDPQEVAKGPLAFWPFD